LAVTTTTTSGGHPRRIWLIVGLLVLLIVGEWGVWLMARADRSSRSGQATVTSGVAGGAVAVSEPGLRTLASLGRSIYWAGPKTGYTYELTQPQDGLVSVRYLPAGTPIGSSNAFLTVGTYPVAGAYAVTTRAARQPEAVTVRVPNGGVAFYRAGLPTNVYVAYPGVNYQIEVFDPSPGEAPGLVAGGAIRQVAGSPSGAANAAALAVQPAQILQLARQLGRALYWTGPRPGTKYELTQTPDGRVYVRYLPAGVRVGTDQQYLTVGTYPLQKAYAITKRLSEERGSVAIKVPGGVAFYNASRPTSAYVAFRGVNEQIEVFDPSPARVRAVVAGGLVRAL
jgi:hypothetical protein